MPKKRGLGQLANLRGGLVKKRGGVFLRGGSVDTPMHTVMESNSNEYHLSHSFPTSMTNSLTSYWRYWRAISVVPNVPSMSLTLLTNKLLSAAVATISVTGQLFWSVATSLNRKISPNLQFLLMVFHFCRQWSVWRLLFSIFS